MRRWTAQRKNLNILRRENGFQHCEISSCKKKDLRDVKYDLFKIQESEAGKGTAENLTTTKLLSEENVAKLK